MGNNPSFDFIITGAGCAGLSLVLRLLQEPLLQQKKILIIDASAKKANDRTWCFWEMGKGFFEGITYHQWPHLVFHSHKATIPLNIAPYNYKMIRGIDFYTHALNIIQQHKNITWLQQQVSEVGNENSNAFAVANGIKYTAPYIFNSIVLPAATASFDNDDCYKLLQHFKGWVIEAGQPIFNPAEATFMDFRVGQQHGTTFVYVLPTSPTRALIEYTFFNERLLPQQTYDALLKEYLKKFWNLENYKIVETEYGTIPMTNHAFKTKDGNIINIGSAGGWTKPTSGFTFQFIQKNTKAIVAALVKNRPPVVLKSFFQKRFDLYDATLLHVLHHHKMQGRQVFHQLFAKQKAPTLFRFLDNESNLFDELKILNSVPSKIFLPAAIQELFALGKTKG